MNLRGCTPARFCRQATGVAGRPARGPTDREVAEELVLSMRTVQSHLSSAYRKLGIASRSELRS
ncbi:MAG TPA: helix-turn-helix transcriptional regulator [Propionibacteriaceae bacterium]|nr:helix-turn-helix transcriptional regulator [Propionibacteriaceae bacterium]